MLHSSTKAFDLAEPVRFEQDRVWIGERRLSRFPPLWGSKIRNLVYQAAFQKEEPDLLSNSAFSKGIGLTAEGAIIDQPISPELPHAIVIGPTGSGKTELVRLIAKHHNSPIWAIDFKGGAGFRSFSRVERLMTVFDPGELDRWQLDFQQRQAKALNPRLLIVVDELGEVLKQPQLAAFIEQIAAKGRSLNVMLVAANQTLSQVSRSIWVNCSNRFSLLSDMVDRSQLGFSGKPPIPVTGYGVAELTNKSGQFQFKFPFGLGHEVTAGELPESTNPLLTRVASRPQ